MKLRISGTFLTVLCTLAGARADAACTYSIAPNAVKVEWTAFKFTEKKGVTGTFNTARLSGPTSAATLTDLAKGLSMEIDGASIESGDPARNATVSEFFFQQFKPTPKITGQAVEVTGDDKSGIVKIKISLNGTSQVVPFAYSIGDKGVVEAKGSVDMLDFALQSAYDTIHKACEEKHVGPDGISKTWTTVDLRLTGAYQEKCG
jgi:polyisoprenoid-binding protein YceI